MRGFKIEKLYWSSDTSDSEIFVCRPTVPLPYLEGCLPRYTSFANANMNVLVASSHILPWPTVSDTTGIHVGIEKPLV